MEEAEAEPGKAPGATGASGATGPVGPTGSSALLPTRWLAVTFAMILLALIAIGSAAYTATIAARSNQQASEIVKLKSDVDHARSIRESEARAKKLRAQGDCRQAIKGTAQARTIVEDLRSTYLELAANAVNPDFIAALRKRARHLPMFPKPKCYPGPKTKPAA